MPGFPRAGAKELACLWQAQRRTFTDILVGVRH